MSYLVVNIIDASIHERSFADERRREPVGPKAGRHELHSHRAHLRIERER